MRTAHRYRLRRGMAAGVVLLTAVMLSACIEASSSSTIASNFTGTSMIRAGFSKAALQGLNEFGNNLGGTPTPNATSTASLNPQNIFVDLTNQATAMGGVATPYDDGVFTGVQITIPFTSLDEMQNQINTLVGGSSPMPGVSSAPASGSTQSPLMTITAKRTATGLRIDGLIDPSLSVLSDPGNPNAVPAPDLSALFAEVDSQVELSFAMPGAITSADPLATQNGKIVSWRFKLGDKPVTIFVEANKS